jgi:hypothetical protein
MQRFGAPEPLPDSPDYGNLYQLPRPLLGNGVTTCSEAHALWRHCAIRCCTLEKCEVAMYGQDAQVWGVCTARRPPQYLTLTIHEAQLWLLPILVPLLFSYCSWSLSLASKWIIVRRHLAERNRSPAKWNGGNCLFPLPSFCSLFSYCSFILCLSLLCFFVLFLHISFFPILYTSVSFFLIFSWFNFSFLPSLSFCFSIFLPPFIIYKSGLVNRPGWCKLRWVHSGRCPFAISWKCSAIFGLQLWLNMTKELVVSIDVMKSYYLSCDVIVITKLFWLTILRIVM